VKPVLVRPGGAAATPAQHGGRQVTAPPSHDPSPGARLRALLERERPLVVPGCADALTARIAADVGFGAVYATGAGISNAMLGLPDLGLASFSEVCGQVAHLCDAVEVPVIADIDTGYGNALNARRAVRAFERAGVAAVQIEDQVFPKRCGHFDGTETIELDEMLGKLRAVLDARRDGSLVVIARTDAIAGKGLDAAVERARAFAAAGADLVFVEAPPTMAALERLPAMVSAPLVANMVEGGRTPLAGADRLGAMGYRMVLHANTALRAGAMAVRDALATLRRDGGSGALLDRLLPFPERQRLVGLPALEALARRYQPHERHEPATTEVTRDA
jgi:2-methylisocitrate lyase-like PEP mutase family enzyme